MVVSSIRQAINSLGFQLDFVSIQEIYKWINSLSLKDIDNPITGNTNLIPFSIKDNSVQFSNIQWAYTGSFGILYSANRNGFPVFLKTSINSQKELVIEGLLQCIAQTTLEQYGFDWAIPRVFDIGRNEHCGYFLCLEKQDEAQVFTKWIETNLHWNPTTNVLRQQNDKLIVQIFIQLATYLHILETELHMNHRDLKDTNILMIKPSDTVIQSVEVKGDKWSYTTNIKAILIDFGFACAGNEYKELAVCASEVIEGLSDISPKEGRDIFFFLLVLWNISGFKESISPKLRDIFKKCLVHNDIPYWELLPKIRQKDPSNFYIFTGGRDFKQELCAPLNFLKLLAEGWPDLITINDS